MYASSIIQVCSLFGAQRFRHCHTAMSSPADIDILSIYSTLRSDYYSGYSATALVVYDYVITLHREIKFFRTRRLSRAFVLFFAVRYIPLLYQILGVISASFDFSPSSCDILVKLANSLLWFHMLPMAVFSAIRANALTKSRIFTAVIFALSLVPLGLNFGLYAYGFSGRPGSVEGCVSFVQVTETEVITFTVASRGCLILADIMLVIATGRMIGFDSSRPQIPWGRKTSILTVMFQNGMVYFAVLTVLNILHLSFTVASVCRNSLRVLRNIRWLLCKTYESGPTSNITLFTDPIITILTYRFLLGLQEASEKDVKLESDHPLHFTASYGTPSFVRDIGSVEPMSTPILGTDGTIVDETAGLEYTSRRGPFP
ncbi:hypothetical protein C8T65DRAFT_658682 [Cerioporus squamosus]|nr:hypothetical protein C8T65DRAFT_658682 [Cerioporus squamosus]